MLSLKHLAFALLLGLAPASSIVTNQARAEEPPAMSGPEEMPSGTMLEIAWWRLDRSLDELSAATERREHAADRMHVLTALLALDTAQCEPPTIELPQNLADAIGIGTRFSKRLCLEPDQHRKAKELLRAQIEDVRTHDARATELAIKVAQLRQNLWVAAEQSLQDEISTAACADPMEKLRAARIETLEDSVLALMSLAGAPPAKAVAPVDPELARRLRDLIARDAGRLFEALKALGEKDAVLTSILLEAEDGTLALNGGRDGSGVDDVYANAMVELERAGAAAAFAKPAWNETYLDEGMKAALQGPKCGELLKVEKFWSTLEVAARLHDAGADEKDASRIAVRLQVERIVRNGGR
jgi:hypothetical protein